MLPSPLCGTFYCLFACAELQGLGFTLLLKSMLAILQPKSGVPFWSFEVSVTSKNFFLQKLFRVPYCSISSFDLVFSYLHGVCIGLVVLQAAKFPLPLLGFDFLEILLCESQIYTQRFLLIFHTSSQNDRTSTFDLKSPISSSMALFFSSCIDCLK